MSWNGVLPVEKTCRVVSMSNAVPSLVHQLRDRRIDETQMLKLDDVPTPRGYRPSTASRMARAMISLNKVVG